MALIVEVLDSRGAEVRARVRLDELPLSVGRGYDNDLILDDAYVDARHARITVSADGTVEVEDLGSINGLVAVGGRERVPRVPAQPGTQVQLGRTILRFRDPAEPVPAALREPRPGGPAAERLLASGWARAAICSAALAIVMLYTWLGSYERDSGSTALAVGIGFMFMAALWCGGWAIASRVALQRFNFVGHLTIFSVILIPLVLYTSASAWLVFLFPDNPLSTPIGAAVMFAFTTLSIALHLGLSSTMSRSRRIRAGALTTGVLTIMIGAVMLTEREMFTDVPEYPGVLKSVGGSMLPTIEVSEFGDVTAELKAAADALVE